VVVRRAQLGTKQGHPLRGVTSELGRITCSKSRANSVWIHGAGYAGQDTQ
jgi:hypothetical protein